MYDFAERIQISPQLAILDHDIIIAALARQDLFRIKFIPGLWTIGLGRIHLCFLSLCVFCVHRSRPLGFTLERHPTRIVGLIVVLNEFLEDFFALSGLELLLDQIEDVENVSFDDLGTPGRV